MRNVWALLGLSVCWGLSRHGLTWVNGGRESCVVAQLVKCCSNMGQICEDNKDLRLAAGYYSKALEGLEQLQKPAAKDGRGADKPSPTSVSEQLLVLNKLAPILQQLAADAGESQQQQQEWVERAAQVAQKTQRLQKVWEMLSSPPEQQQQQQQPKRNKPKQTPDKACAGPGCGLPNTPAMPLKRCAGCRKVWYCGNACQKKHFKTGHKQNCHKD